MRGSIRFLQNELERAEAERARAQRQHENEIANWRMKFVQLEGMNS
jgi:hypothetical protein